MLAWKNIIGHCAYCGLKIEDTDQLTGFHSKWTKEHVIPHSKLVGPKHRLSNMIVACYDCNKKRGNMQLIAFRKIQPLWIEEQGFAELNDFALKENESVIWLRQDIKAKILKYIDFENDEYRSDLKKSIIC